MQQRPPVPDLLLLS